MTFAGRMEWAVLVLAGGLFIGACGDDAGRATTTGEPIGGVQSTQPSGTPGAGAPTTSSLADPGPSGETGFVPQRPLPEGFPVFPGAELWGEVPEAPGGHGYLFGTGGVDPGVCEFFGWSLADLGFAVEADCTDPRGFHVEASKGGTRVVTVGFTDEPGGIGAGYLLVIDYDVWRDEWLG